MDTEMINDKVSQGIMLISAEKYDAAKLLLEDIIAEAPRTMEAYIHLGNACANLGKYDEAIESFKKALLVDPNYVEAYFSIGSMDTVYTKREDAGKALLGLLGMAMNRTEPVSIGRYKGFDLQIAYFAMDKMYLAYLVGSGINPVQLGADAVGNTVRLDNCLHNLPQSVTDLESKLVQLQKQLENAKEQLAQPFAQADELAEKSKRLAELEALLNLNEKDIVLDTVPDEEQQCRSDNRQRGQER